MKPMRFCQAVVSWTQRCLAALLQKAEDDNDAFGPEDAEDICACLNMDSEEEEEDPKQSLRILMLSMAPMLRSQILHSAQRGEHGTCCM